MGSAYVDLLLGDDHVGAATYCLSHSWDSAIGDIADALDQYCRDAGLAPKQTYVWLPFLCANLHRQRRASKEGPEQRTAEVFKEEMIRRMKTIGKVLALMDCWDGRQYTKRTWCMSEMCIALSLGAKVCKFTFIMPPAESGRLAAQLRNCGTAITNAWASLVDLQLEKTVAHSPQDKEALLQMLRSYPGIAAARTIAARQLQMWLITTCEGCVRQLLANGGIGGQQAARVCDMMGWLLREVALYHRATAMLQDGLQLSLSLERDSSLQFGNLLSCIGTAKGPCSNQESALQALGEAKRAHERQNTLQSPEGAAVLASIGAARWMSGDPDGALKALLAAYRIRQDICTLEMEDGAVLLRNIGIIKWAKGDSEGALKAYAESREVRERIGRLGGPDGAALLLSIGFARADRGDARGALEAYEDARHLLGPSGVLETPSGATLITSIGVVHGNCGDQAAAARAYAQARLVRETTATLPTCAGAVLLRNIGVALAATGASARALDAYAEAVRLREQMGTLETPAGATLLTNVGVARAECGDRTGALQALRQAKAISERTGTMQTNNGKMLLKHLANLETAA